MFGNYVDSLKHENGFIDSNGLITTIDVPGAASTSITGVNASGAIAGMFTDGNGVAHGFIDNNGVFTTVDPTGATKTYVVGVSDAGAVAGSYVDSANNEHGFINQNGVVTTINIPGSNNVGVSAENAAGEVVGNYSDSAGNSHGFVDNNGVVSTVDVPGAIATDIVGVNGSGEIFGLYIDATGVEHGFAAQIASLGSGNVVQAMTDDGANEVGIGHVVTITLNASATEIVTGTPTLRLSDNEVATYVGGSGTNALQFSYTVQPGDNTSDLQVTGLNLPSGATIHDASGNAFSTAVTADLGIQVVTTVTNLQTSEDGLVYLLYQATYGPHARLRRLRILGRPGRRAAIERLATRRHIHGGAGIHRQIRRAPEQRRLRDGALHQCAGTRPGRRRPRLWEGQANSGVARDQLLVAFATSAENHTLTAPHTANGYWVT